MASSLTSEGVANKLKPAFIAMEIHLFICGDTFWGEKVTFLALSLSLDQFPKHINCSKGSVARWSRGMILT